MIPEITDYKVRRDYAESTNPPVLHRKETFLASDAPLRTKFAKLTEQELKAGLLDEPAGLEPATAGNDGSRKKDSC